MEYNISKFYHMLGKHLFLEIYLSLIILFFGYDSSTKVLSIVVLFCIKILIIHLNCRRLFSMEPDTMKESK